MRRLNHPNVVRLYEVIEDVARAKVLLVLEYCEAGALVGPGALTPGRNLPEAMCQYYFRQMAAGLAYLHANHVVRLASHVPARTTWPTARASQPHVAWRRLLAPLPIAEGSQALSPALAGAW